LERPYPDLAVVAAAPVAALLPAGLDGRLEPVFTEIVRRTKRQVNLGQATRVDIVLDEGTLIVADAREPINEVAFAVRDGSLEPVYRLALELHALTPLSLAVESRVDRGYRLKRGGKPLPTKAVPVGFPRDVVLHEALRRAVGATLMHLLSNCPATVIGDDAEGVHQMRVAMRRLRSILALFAKHLDIPAASRFGVASRDLGRVLGDARDLGVFILETLPHVGEGEDGVDLAPLRAAAEARLRLAHERVEAAILDPGFTRLVLTLLAWTEGKTWARPGKRGKSSRNRPLVDLAPKMLNRLERKVARLGRAIGGGDPEGLHDLRKALKRLRYGIEYLGSLYPRAEVKHYLNACGKLQDALGTVNDMENAARFALNLSDEAIDHGRGAAAALVKRSCQEKSKEAQDRLRPLWRNFEQARPFWK